MKLPRRDFLQLAAGTAAALPAVSRIARAQTYPTRAVTLIVFVAAGATPDIIARLIGQSLSQRLGQSVIIDNRPGGGGNLALQAVARAPADGYTLLLVATPPSTRRYMRRALSASRATSSRLRASTAIPSPC
jgi:tripartite-type tricarboxylate transporter receptor subunit TctC